MYQVSSLNNGVTVATAEMPHMTSVSVGLWLGVGARYESAELNGVCHFIEHLLFKGTRKRSAKEISQAVEGIGGYLNAFTSEEALHKYCKTGGESLNLESKYEELLSIFVTKELAEFISLLILDMLEIEEYARPAAREILKDLDVQLGA